MYYLAYYIMIALIWISTCALVVYSILTRQRSLARARTRNAKA